MKPVYALWCLLLLLAGTFTSSQNHVFFASTPQSVTDKSFFRLGTSLITISTTTHLTERSFVLVSLHHNETTAIDAARSYVEEHGGQMICLENEDRHNIEFEFFNEEYSIDPNKIFTQKGRANLLKSGPYKNTLSVEVQRFADYLVEIIPHNKHVIGVHNYEDGERNIKNFRKKKLSRKMKTSYQNPEMDASDFVVTTDANVFNHLKEKKINVVLQNQTVVRDDGTLGLVIPKYNRVYIDVFAQTGHLEQQQQMIAALAEILEP